MSIENLKKILESESKGSGIKYDEESCIISLDDKEIGQWNNEAFRDQPEDLIWRRNISSTFHEAFQAGHEAATNRLLPLLENAFNILSEINIDNPSFEDSRLELVEIQIDKRDIARIREFLAEFTNMTEIKKEGV